MTTKPSSAPWADEPHALLSTPSKDLVETHGCFLAATEMVGAHNIIIRGLNAIVQQGPGIPASSDARYRAQDVKDFLRYVNCWVKMVNHHHWGEESFFFPELEKVCNQPGRMSGLQHEHDLFESGMEKLGVYTKDTKPEDFRWDGPGGMKAITDELSVPLVNHLHGEIDTLIGLQDLDGQVVKELWGRVGEYAKNSKQPGILSDIFPCVLGTDDRTFEGGKAPNKLPWFLPYLVRYWFALGDGAWQFNPCDFWGQPRQLVFVADP